MMENKYLITVSHLKKVRNFDELYSKDLVEEALEILLDEKEEVEFFLNALSKSIVGSLQKISSHAAVIKSNLSIQELEELTADLIKDNQQDNYTNYNGLEYYLATISHGRFRSFDKQRTLLFN